MYARKGGSGLVTNCVAYKKLMKIKLCIVFLLWCVAMNTFAQQQYQLMGLVVDKFLQDRGNKFKEIEITWNMEGAIQADLNDGINYLHEEKLTLAQGSLNIVLQKNPTTWQAYYYRAITRKLQKNYFVALGDLKAALKLNPKLYEAQVEIAKCYLATNLLVEAENAARRAIQLNKKRADAYYVKGCIHESQGQAVAAINSFRECLKADSSYHDAHIDIAIVALVLNKDEARAINELTAVLTLDSLQQDALLMRSILVFDKNKQQSLRDLTKLISVSPNNMIAFYLRGILHADMQQYYQGFSDFQTVIKATSTDDNNFEGRQTWIDKKIDLQNVGAYTVTRVYGLEDADATKLKQAYCLILTNAFEKSIAVINSISNPNEEPLAVYLKAVANEHQGKHNEAFILYNEAIRLDNTIADAYKKRGIYEQELKQWEKSIDDFTTVLRLLPETYVIYKLRGVSYYHNKQLSKAIADYSIYLNRDSTNKQVIEYRGVAYKENNQRLNAYIDFSTAHSNIVLPIADILHLVDSVLQKGDTTLALKALTGFVKANPGFTELYALKLKVHLTQNDWSPIEADLLTALRNVRPNTPKEDHAYLLTVKGMLMSKTNHPDEAFDAFNQAVNVDKKNALAYLERGKTLLAKNKTAKAIEDLKKSESFGNTTAKKMLEKLVQPKAASGL
jgi:tetratricopeptide (TPR) repeat protein